MSTATAGDDAPPHRPAQDRAHPVADCGPRGARHLLLRPILPQDEALLSDFLMAQSAAARRSRFHAAIKPSPRLCQQMSRVDPRRALALVACTWAGGLERLVAEARYSVSADGRSAEFALMVDERWQRRGIGRWALDALTQAARRAGLAWLEGEVRLDNAPMLALARCCGFGSAPDPQDAGVLRVRHRLRHADACDADACDAAAVCVAPARGFPWPITPVHQ